MKVSPTLTLKQEPVAIGPSSRVVSGEIEWWYYELLALVVPTLEPLSRISGGHGRISNFSLPSFDEGMFSFYR